MKKIILSSALVGIMLLASSCASIVSKSVYPVSINSSPSGATISITDKKGSEVFLGNTPTTVRLKAGAGFFSRAEYQVRFSNPGYDDKIVPITFKLDGWYFGNILLGGVIGMLIVDPATGAMWKLDLEYIHETLRPTIAFVEPEIKIVDINEIPEDWKQYLVKVD